MKDERLLTRLEQDDPAVPRARGVATDVSDCRSVVPKAYKSSKWTPERFEQALRECWFEQRERV